VSLEYFRLSPCRGCQIEEKWSGKKFFFLSLTFTIYFFRDKKKDERGGEGRGRRDKRP
jgi:hypothetical protein